MRCLCGATLHVLTHSHTGLPVYQRVAQKIQERQKQKTPVDKNDMGSIKHVSSRKLYSYSTQKRVDGNWINTMRQQFARFSVWSKTLVTILKPSHGRHKKGKSDKMISLTAKCEVTQLAREKKMQHTRKECLYITARVQKGILIREKWIKWFF